MDQITNNPAAEPAGPPPEDAPAPSQTLRMVLLALTGLFLIGVGLIWVLRYGYGSWWLTLLLALPAAVGVGALAGAWVIWRRKNRSLTVAAAVLALLLLTGAGRPALSPWYHRAAEERAWQRYQESSAPVKERWLAYNATVPEPFRRPQPEIDYQLSRVKEYAGVPHMLRQLLRDLEALHQDDPNFDPVREAAREALAAVPPGA
jgi:hypothetical protein